MNQNMNEDLMWERLKDIQMEVESSRINGPRLWPSAWHAARLLGERAWLLAGVAAGRSPRRRRTSREGA